ncbi:hypothetical protein RHSIM_Rhsim07G0147400 [Rhododendron simsii]|uniref:Uncharacterized protein n=1 Tax=Rhododendron simsii TaxID=118357 RepID=A0A834GQZ4_RHOSS|nr:hypothetical protein RHSIM_Rhsim07G0147400 [Rhododendron simsii]
MVSESTVTDGLGTVGDARKRGRFWCGCGLVAKPHYQILLPFGSDLLILMVTQARPRDTDLSSVGSGFARVWVLDYCDVQASGWATDGAALLVGLSFGQQDGLLLYPSGILRSDFEVTVVSRVTVLSRSGSSPDLLTITEDIKLPMGLAAGKGFHLRASQVLFCSNVGADQINIENLDGQSSVGLRSVQALTVTPIWKENHRVDCDHPKESSSSPPDTHSIREELSDSEDELLEVLEWVVSSNQKEGVLNQSIKTATSLAKVQSELKSSLATEPPDQLDPGVSKVAADLVSKGSAGFNKFLFKSAKKRLKKQAMEESISSFSNRRNLIIPSS